MATLIEFKKVTKAYQIGEVKIQALAGVDFSISEGEFVVILGASGAGKSTILNILGGMDTASSGHVFVADQEITGWSEKKLTEYRGEQVGFVFQFYNLIPNLNALENVEFATEVCKDHLDARDILHKVGLAACIDKDRLLLSHQCGFASCDGGNELSEAEQWAKINQGQQIAKQYWNN